MATLTYKEMKQKHTDEYKKFIDDNMFFAFNMEQFRAGLS